MSISPVSSSPLSRSKRPFPSEDEEKTDPCERALKKNRRTLLDTCPKPIPPALKKAITSSCLGEAEKARHSKPTCPLLRKSVTMGCLGEKINIRLTPDQQEMIKVTKRAARDYSVSSATLPIEEIKRPTKPLKLSFSATTEKGKRLANEDHHLIFHKPLGDFFAVFDGHGLIDKDKLKIGEDPLGKEFSKFAAQLLEERLPSMIRDSNYNIGQAFKNWCLECQENLPVDWAGTTAVLCFFEKVTHYFYTGTVGDSKAFVFREKNGKMCAIPLSPDLTWANPEAEKRVEEILDSQNFEKWKSQTDPKRRRFPPGIGINVPSSLGDKCMHINGETAISHEPYCSMIQVKEKDIIVIACDGVWDFLPFTKMMEEVIEPHKNDPKADLAQIISEEAFKAQRAKTRNFTGSSGDNITVIAVRVSDLNQELSEDDPTTQSLTLSLEYTL